MAVKQGGRNASISSRHGAALGARQRLSSGPAAAVVLAAGVGSLTMGLTTILSRVSNTVAERLSWPHRAGPISGQAILASFAFFCSWGLLARAWRHSDPPLGAAALATSILVVVALVATYPPLLQLVARD